MSASGKMEETQRRSEDMWTPFKNLQFVIDKVLSGAVDITHLELDDCLRKHKQNFLTLLKNPPKNPTYREELNRGMVSGITVPGVGHQILSRELVQETTIISDMYDLNEYMALDLLCTAQLQMPNHPGLPRGLVAILLYYDGRKSLVSSLRSLIQLRQGVLWCPTASKTTIETIENYTNELLRDGLFNRIFELLSTLDLSKEIELLQKNRALGGPKHHREVLDLFQQIRLILADIVCLWAAQTGLPRDVTLRLIGFLRTANLQDDPTGGIDDVTFTLEMALLYAVDLSMLQHTEDEEHISETLEILKDKDFLDVLVKEFGSERPIWSCEGLHSLSMFAFGLSLAALRLSGLPLCTTTEHADVLIDQAIQAKVFDFTHRVFLENKLCYREEIYTRRIHSLITDFIVLMHSKVKDLRLRADETARTIQIYTQEGLEAPSNLPRYFENFLLTVSKFYSKDELDLKLIMEYWTSAASTSTLRLSQRAITLFKFVRQAGEHIPPTLFVPYVDMLSSLSTCQFAAKHTFNLLKQNGPGNVSTVSWDHFFNSLNQYYVNLRQEAPLSADTVYPVRNHPRGITPMELQGLHSVLRIIKTVAQYDGFSRIALCEHPVWAPLNILLGLVTCSVPIPLKADLLSTLTALCQSPETAAQMWNNLEASQVLITVPSTSSYQPRGVQTELEEIESRLEEYVLTRAFLSLLKVLVSSGVPRMLGAGPRKPGFDPYLTFIINSVFVKFSSRSYKNPEEKWQVAKLCLELFVKLLDQYDPQISDFPNQRSDINPPPGFHLMLQVNSKTDLLRLLLYVIDEGVNLLDSYVLFHGKSYMEETVLLCLKLLEQVFQLQDKFFSLVNSTGGITLLSKLDKLLMGVNPRTLKPDFLIKIAKYTTYNTNLPHHALSAIKILLAMTDKPSVNSHILGQLEGNIDLKSDILHGFVECLDTSNDDDTDISEAAADIKSSTKIAIFKLLKQCLALPAPNLAHYLLGFDINKDVRKTVLQLPGVLGSPRTCLHSIFSILNSGLNSKHGGPKPNSSVIESAYSMLYLLCANLYTTESTLRFIRSNNEFLNKHIIALPLNINNAVILNQVSWLLKIVAIEFKLSADSNHISQLTMLIKLFLGYSVPVADLKQVNPADLHEQIEEKTTNRLVDLLRNLNFNSDQLPIPRWEYFDNSLMEKLLKNCEYTLGGIRIINVKQLHRVLMDELSTLQGSAASSQKQLIVKEIEKVLTYAITYNKWKNKCAASHRFMDSWRQVAEIIFMVVPSEILPLELQQTYIIEILNALLFLLVPSGLPTDIGNIISEAIFMLFVSLRKANQTQIKRSSIESSGLKFDSLSIYSNTTTLENILQKVIEWIVLSEVVAQKLRVNLYAALLLFMRVLNKNEKSDEMNIKEKHGTLYVNRLDSTKYRVSNDTRYTITFEKMSLYGEKLFEVLCHDCTGGNDVCKMIALATMDMMIEVDHKSSWIRFICTRGYLKHIIDSIHESDALLKSTLDPMPEALRPLYLYESKMSLLNRIAMSRTGAEILLEQKALTCLSIMRVYDFHPEIHRSVNILRDDFVPPVENRYQQILFPALNLCSAIITSLGPINQSACVQIVHFISSHAEAIELLLRSGNPSLPSNVLKELVLITGIIARTTNYEINSLLEESTAFGYNASYLTRMQKLMLSLFPRFVLTETVLKDLLVGTNENETGKTENRSRLLYSLQIACNLALYARNSIVGHGIDHRSTGVIFPPTLNDSLINDSRYQFVNIGDQTPSLGVVIKQLQQTIQYYHKEKLTLEFLTRKLSSVPQMNSTDLKEYYSGSENKKFNIIECRVKAYEVLSKLLEDKRTEIEYCTFLIENSLYLIWAHLDYYMLRAIPKTQVTKFDISSTIIDTTLAAATEVSWRVNAEDISNLKQSLIGIFNDTFSQQLISTTQGQLPGKKGFLEALLRRIKRLIQFVPVK